jgi:hypothetical protein
VALGLFGRAQLILPGFPIWTAQYVLPAFRIWSAEVIVVRCAVGPAQHLVLAVFPIRFAELILVFWPVGAAQHVSCIAIWLCSTIVAGHLYLLPRADI